MATMFVMFAMATMFAMFVVFAMLCLPFEQHFPQCIKYSTFMTKPQQLEESEKMRTKAIIASKPNYSEENQ